MAFWNSSADLSERVKALEKRVSALEEQLNDALAQRSRTQAADPGIAPPDQNLQQRAADAMAEALRKQGEALRKAASTAPSSGNIGGSGAMPESCFSYEHTPNGIVITGLTLFDIPESITIPAYIEGKPVVKIGNSAFKTLAIRRVILPETVKELGSYAFSDCTRLVSISAPSAAAIGYRCFENCKGLVTVDLPSAVSFGSYCFFGCSSLDAVDLPSATDIGSSCFSNSGIRNILIPGSVRTIPANCFKNCQNLKKVVICDGVAKIEGSAFAYDQLPSLILPKSVATAGYLDDSDNTYTFKCGKIAVLGMNTRVTNLPKESIVYCLPGSAVQQDLQKWGYKIQPLSAFTED